MKQIVLASASPRRKELLMQIGIVPVVCPTQQPELSFERGGADEAEAIARQKGMAAAQMEGLPPEALILAADTIVTINGEILGKPKDIPQAREMLTKLSGRVHQVITGLYLLNTANGQSESTYALTEVWFKSLSPKKIDSYIASGEGWDKAGGYGIQGLGAVLVKRIEGSYSNVVGLPIETAADMLERFGCQVLQGIMT